FGRVVRRVVVGVVVEDVITQLLTRSLDKQYAAAHFDRNDGTRSVGGTALSSHVRWAYGLVWLNRSDQPLVAVGTDNEFVRLRHPHCSVDLPSIQCLNDRRVGFDFTPDLGCKILKVTSD